MNPSAQAAQQRRCDARQPDRRAKNMKKAGRKNRETRRSGFLADTTDDTPTT